MTDTLENEEQASERRVSDWGEKLRFDRSFYAKLTLSDRQVKEYYAEIATELLSYEKVRASMSWAGVGFTAGRSRIAYIAFRGKTLCLYLALDPDTLTEGRYKAQNVAEVKSRAKTPAMFRIRSDGAKRNALARIAETAECAGLLPRPDGGTPVSAKDFPADTFGNLITRGLIRVLRRDSKAGQPPLLKTANPVGEKPLGTYEDTVATAEELLSRHAVYRDLSLALSEGEGRVEYSEKHMLRAIDEIWVRAVEDAVASLDRLIRNPNHYIAESEDVLPIEMTKKITGRSIAHLARHTNYLNTDSDGEITPTKMLNIFRDDSLLTYENKFLNTLLNRLYLFVNRRYTVAKERGIDETVETLTFESDFESGRGRGKVRIEVSYSERPEEETTRRVPPQGGLYARVERLNDIVTGYIHSEFARTMEKNFIHPPVMRTNAIMKNKYFRECLALWEFIERYEDAGYGITVDETKKEVSAEYIKELYKGAVTQYFLFRHARDMGYGEDGETETYALRPDYVAESAELSDPFSESFTEEREEGAPTEDDDLTAALLVALLADEIQSGYGETDGFSYTFHARLRLSEEDLKENFARLSNALLSYDRVKMRHSNAYAAYTAGRQTIARIAIAGKSMRLYLALDPAALPEKYRAEDRSDVSRYEDTPALVRVRSRRSVKYALELLSLLAEKFSLSAAKKAPVPVSSGDYPVLPVTEMIGKGWIAVKKRPVFSPDRSPFAGIPFGTAKRAEAERLFRSDEKLAVNEGEKTAEMIRDGAYLPKEEKPSARPSAVHALHTLIRPEGSYDTPTEYGLDDSSGFMQDSREEEKKEEETDALSPDLIKEIFGRGEKNEE